MNCQEARELFSAKADDRLAAAERLALDRHLQDCLDCPGEWGRFRQTVALLHSMEEVRAPAGFAGRVLEAARREQEPWPRRLWRGLFVPFHVKLPLEAAAVLVLSTLVMLLYRHTPELKPPALAPASPELTATAPAPAGQPAAPEERRRSVEAPTSFRGRASSPPPLAKRSASESVGTPPASSERDQPQQKEEPGRVEEKVESGRADTARETQKSAAPPRVGILAAPSQGPFHLVGVMRPQDVGTIAARLDELVRRVGGTLIRDPTPIGAGSIVEVVLSRDDYPRLEAGLRQIGDFTVETRAPSFPEQLHIAIRIANSP